ncbi:unnamed protein product, partial [Closterium sp. NIES-53]
MERRYAWLQHMVRHGKFVLKYIPTTEQPADFLTKALHFPAFNRCSVAIGQVRLVDVVASRSALPLPLFVRPSVALRISALSSAPRVPICGGILLGVAAPARLDYIADMVRFSHRCAAAPLPALPPFPRPPRSGAAAARAQRGHDGRAVRRDGGILRAAVGRRGNEPRAQPGAGEARNGAGEARNGAGEARNGAGEAWNGAGEAWNAVDVRGGLGRVVGAARREVEIRVGRWGRRMSADQLALRQAALRQAARSEHIASADAMDSSLQPCFEGSSSAPSPHRLIPLPAVLHFAACRGSLIRLLARLPFSHMKSSCSNSLEHEKLGREGDGLDTMIWWRGERVHKSWPGLVNERSGLFLVFRSEMCVLLGFQAFCSKAHDVVPPGEADHHHSCASMALHSQSMRFAATCAWSCHVAASSAWISGAWLAAGWVSMALEAGVLLFLMHGIRMSASEALLRTAVIASILAGADAAVKASLVFHHALPLFHPRLNVATPGAVWLFWLAHDALRAAVYAALLSLPLSQWRDTLPARPAFHRYLLMLLLLHSASAFASLLLALHVSAALCMRGVAVCVYWALFPPLLYITFLADFFQ